MASYHRDGHFRLCRASAPSSTWGSGSREPGEYGPGGLVPPPPPLPPRLLDQLVADMQSHLDEMARLRAALADAYPACPQTAPTPRPKLRDRDEHDAARYRFSLDVAGWAPEQLAAKLDGRKLTLSGKSSKRTEAPDGCVSHEFREVRKEILLPQDAQLDGLACNFIPETGRLLVEAPRLAPLPADAAGPIAIPIQRAPADAAPDNPPAGEKTPPGSPEKGAPPN